MSACSKLALLGFGLDRRFQLMNRRYVASLVDGSSRFIGSGGLKLYEFVADVAGHSKIAVISHWRASQGAEGWYGGNVERKRVIRLPGSAHRSRNKKKP